MRHYRSSVVHLHTYTHLRDYNVQPLYCFASLNSNSKQMQSLRIVESLSDVLNRETIHHYFTRLRVMLHVLYCQ